SPETATVDPRRRPPSGSSPARAGSTGSVRSPARETGRVWSLSSRRSARAGASATARCGSAIPPSYERLFDYANRQLRQLRGAQARAGVGQGALFGPEAQSLAHTLHVTVQAAGVELPHLTEVGPERPEGVAEAGGLALPDQEVAGPRRAVAQHRRSGDEHRVEQGEAGGPARESGGGGAHVDRTGGGMGVLARVVRPELLEVGGVGGVDAGNTVGHIHEDSVPETMVKGTARGRRWLRPAAPGPGRRRPAAGRHRGCRPWPTPR